MKLVGLGSFSSFCKAVCTADSIEKFQAELGDTTSYYQIIIIFFLFLIFLSLSNSNFSVSFPFHLIHLGNFEDLACK